MRVVREFRETSSREKTHYSEMDLVSMLMFGLMSCAIGAVLMLLVQYYAFVRYFRMPELTQEQQEQCRRSAHSEPYELPGVSGFINL